MCVGDLVSFDPPNKMQSTSWQLELPLECAVTAGRPGLAWHNRGLWHCIWGGAAQGFAATSASEPSQWLFSKGAWAAASKLWVQTSVSVLCCAGDWCKPFDIVFRRSSMDLRGITNSATCWLLSGILTLHYIMFTFSPWLLPHGLLENLLYPETGFSQWSIMQMLIVLLTEKEKGSWVELDVLT